MSPFKYNRLDKENVAFLLVDHQSGLTNLVQDISPDDFKNNVLPLPHHELHGGQGGEEVTGNDPGCWPGARPLKPTRRSVWGANGQGMLTEAYSISACGAWGATLLA